jgi:hypothetical protein
VPRGKSFGFAQFSTHEAAKEAMYALEGLQLMKAKWGKPREDKEEHSYTKPPLPPGPPPKPPGPPAKKMNKVGR